VAKANDHAVQPCPLRVRSEGQLRCFRGTHGDWLTCPDLGHSRSEECEPQPSKLGARRGGGSSEQQSGASRYRGCHRWRLRSGTVDDAPYIDTGLEQVPTDWLNQRLVELGERWQIDEDDTLRTLRSLDH
jgi:hypothetical protein